MQKTPQIIGRPALAWPTQADLASMTTSELHERADFFGSWMLAKFLLSVVVAIAILSWNSWCPCFASVASLAAQPERYERLAREELDTEGPVPDSESVKDGAGKGQDQAVPPEALTIVTGAASLAQLILVSYVTMTAASESQLSLAYGLPWEGYDLCLTAGLLWFLAQALALRAWLPGTFSKLDIALSSLAFLPFLGDAFDTLKDARFRRWRARTIFALVGVRRSSCRFYDRHDSVRWCLF